MTRTFKAITAIFVGLAFVATAVLCCCVIKNSLAGAQKLSCPHCASKASHKAAGGECCFSKSNPMEALQNLNSGHALPLLTFAVISFFYVSSFPRLALRRSVYHNRPPGSGSIIPLYIQARRLRI